MNTERFQRVQALFAAACDLPQAYRAAFLERACGDDRELRVEVEALLASASGAKTQAGESGVHDGDGEAPRPRKERRIGAYRLVREIGSGGMGAVYLAVRDDDAYHNQVAIKLLHQGLETVTAVARFRDERQILATLDHPGIVRLLDGGSTEDGLPYLVMEHVEGVPITLWADLQRIGVTARVQLFRRVCDAVAYAHQKLVVHRDIKPGNILVTADGAPKLLDFGIAKLSAPTGEIRREAQTRTGTHLLTPEYAAPEQLRGESASIASDVYSLGVVLYELLTGAPVHRFEGKPLESLRARLEVDAQKPSAVAPEPRRRALAGDLDNILLKALSKDPARRYASVEQFSQDLARHLGGEPVLARPATIRYRTGKFVRRHRAAVAALSVVLVSLTAATVVSLRQARRADEQAQRAQRRFDDVRRLANAMLFEVDEQLIHVEGAIAGRQVLVNRVLEYMDSLAAEAGDDPALLREVAEAYVKVGDIQGGPFVANLNNTPQALETHTKALKIFEHLESIGHGDTAWQRASLHAKLAAHHAEVADHQAAQQNTLAAIALVEAQPEDASFDHGLASLIYNRQIRREVQTGNLAGIERYARSAIAVAERWQAAPDRPPSERHVLYNSLRSTAIWRIHSGDPEAAAAAQDAAAAGFASLMAEYPHHRQWLFEYTDTVLAGSQYHGAAGPRWDPSTGEVAVAEAQLTDLVARLSAHMEAETKDQHMRIRLKHSLIMLAATTGERSPSEALIIFDRASAIPTPDEGDGSELCLHALTLARAGHADAALAAAERGVARSRESAGRRGLLFPVATTRCLFNYARTLAAIGDIPAAVQQLDDAATLARGTITNFDGVIMPYVGFVAIRELQASLDPDRRCALLAEAEAVWRTWPHASNYTRRRLDDLTLAQADCPRPDTAP